jgi:hypothetical protein
LRIALLIGVTTILLAGVLWFAVPPGVFSRNGGVCDGSVPVGYPGEGGCSEVLSLVEHVWPPARWGAPSDCQGMCLRGIDEVTVEYRIREE